MKKKRARNSFEEVVMKDLSARGVAYEYELTTLPFQRPQRVSHYTPDFRLPNGVFVETKGRFDSKDRTKLLLVREQNPGVDIRLLFQRDNYMTKTHKRRYSTWAKEHGFKWAVGTKVPARWLKK